MENWKIINGFENYEVSDLGRIRRVDNKKVLKQCDRGNGYRCIHLSTTEKRQVVNTHRLVALAFLENPHNKTQVNHKNEIKTDNRAYNLEWVTPSENSLHSSHKTVWCDRKAKKLRCKQTNVIYESSYKAAEWLDETIYKGSLPIRNLANNIRKSCNNKQAKAWGYTWEFIE